MPISTTFSERLVKARSSLGWSQAQLAEASGISATQISRYESDVSTPRPQAVGKLANALNVSFDWLAHGVGPVDGPQEERSTSVPKGWAHVELEIPTDLLNWLQRSGESLGMSSEARLLQILQQSVDAERSNREPTSLGEIITRLAALEKQQKELASRVRSPSDPNSSQKKPRSS